MLQRTLYWISALAIFILACALRIGVWHPATIEPGFDEQVYVRYVEQIAASGWTGFPEIVRTYVIEVQQAEFVYLPPLRVGYLSPAWMLHALAGCSIYEALRLVAAFASCAFVLTGFIFARRWLTPKKALAVLALLACAPLQIHLGQYAFIDALAGLCAILVVGCVWESLQQPRHLGWLAGTAASFFLLSLTKQETAVFVSVFLFPALLVARRAGFAESHWRTFLALTGAGIAAVATLALLSGGLRTMLAAFSIYHERAQTLPYSILTGDGPWHRYLLEYLLINPLVFLLAVGFALGGDLGHRRNVFLLSFVVITGAVMTSIPNGMNIRHTVMWDFPLAFFAVQNVATLTVGRARHLIWAAAVIAVVCYSGLRQYGTIFRGLYDTDPRFMLKAVRILK
jgi:4-amino-4-deoxy-L-arabinose transferase-like glycosyltransferase